MNCILKYCMEREICESDRTTIVSVTHFCSYIRIIYKYLKLMCINLLIIASGLIWIGITEWIWKYVEGNHHNLF
jgi:hypothetical protein